MAYNRQNFFVFCYSFVLFCHDYHCFLLFVTFMATRNHRKLLIQSWFIASQRCLTESPPAWLFFPPPQGYFEFQYVAAALRVVADYFLKIQAPLSHCTSNFPHENPHFPEARPHVHAALERLLRQTTYRKIDIDNFLNPLGNSWSSFDPELGYLPRTVVMQDGIDGSHSSYTYPAGGWRKMIQAADQPCRINTYGNSYAQCQQVSDGETWQEALAAHFGEPLRNFGVGGYGVHQACRRARRMESGKAGAPYLILNIYDDDHVRNLDATRWVRTFADAAPPPPDRPIMLHGIPWTHVRFDLTTSRFVDQPGPCPNEAALRALCDPEHYIRLFARDQIVRMFMVERGAEPPAADLKEFESLAEALGISVDLRTPATRRTEMRRLRLQVGIRATEHILTETQSWLATLGRRLLILLTYRESFVVDAINAKPRTDQHLLDFLVRRNIPFVDTRDLHIADYAAYRLSPEAYITRFYIPPCAAAVFGHYTPLANAWFAHAIKPAVLNWLTPPPPAYRPPDACRPPER